MVPSNRYILLFALLGWGRIGSAFFCPQATPAVRICKACVSTNRSPFNTRISSSTVPRQSLRMMGMATEIVADDFQIKSDLLSQIDLATSGQKRTKVNELLLKLEPMNPTSAPATSLALNGVWEFLYTGGLNPGTLAVQVLSRMARTFSAAVDLKEVTLSISRDQPRVEASVKLVVFGTEGILKVRTRLEMESDVRLAEVYEEAEIAGYKIPIPKRLQKKRTLFVTYLDDDIMIARDDTGAPDLLIRKEKEFMSNDGVPSSTEEDAAPGSG